MLGMSVKVSPDPRRYAGLPAEVLPGIPWPLWFREEFNAWALEFFQPCAALNPVPDGTVHVLHQKTLVMNPRTYAQFKRAVKEPQA